MDVSGGMHLRPPLDALHYATHALRHIQFLKWDATTRRTGWKSFPFPNAIWMWVAVGKGRIVKVMNGKGAPKWKTWKFDWVLKIDVAPVSAFLRFPRIPSVRRFYWSSFVKAINGTPSQVFSARPKQCDASESSSLRICCSVASIMWRWQMRRFLSPFRDVWGCSCSGWFQVGWGFERFN